MIKCVIFDCDGTLVDSETLSSDVLSIKLEEYNIFESGVKLTDQNRGAKFVDVLKRLEIDNNVVFKNDFVKEFRALVAEHFIDNLQAFENVDFTLSQLTLPICVASNAPVNQLHTALQVTELKQYFHAKIFSAYDINSWKPDPALFLYAAEQMGFKPNECLVVEDSPVGISAGVAAGMQSVLYDPKDLFKELPFDFKISDMQELISIIESNT